LVTLVSRYFEDAAVVFVLCQTTMVWLVCQWQKAIAIVESS